VGPKTGLDDAKRWKILPLSGLEFRPLGRIKYHYHIYDITVFCIDVKLQISYICIKLHIICYFTVTGTLDNGLAMYNVYISNSTYSYYECVQLTAGASGSVVG
jgi:hypothetical protein